MKKFVGLAALLIVLTGCGGAKDDTKDNTGVASSTETIVSSDSKEKESEMAKADDEKEKTIDITLSADGKEFDHKTIDIESDEILLDVMKKNFDIKEEKGMIVGIDGHEQDTKENKFWMYDVNGEFVEVGASEYKVQPGDNISWKLGE